MRERRSVFPQRGLPAALLAPQLALTLVFFVWPAAEAVLSSLRQEDPFGLSARFIGLDNFAALLGDPLYLASAGRTLVFCAAVTALSMSVALFFAIFADRQVRGRSLYRVLLIWPYAVAPAIAGVLWVLLLHPQIGPLGRWLNSVGIAWDYKLNGGQAMLIVILASAWKQVSYNFIFFLAGLQSIPRAVIEAASIDGARGWSRLRAITLPLLVPTISFLVVVNLVYAAFDTFSTVQALTQGGPGEATETLVVKVYRDGVVNQEIGSSSAQSVLLMAAVVLLTLLKFRVMRRGDTR